MKDFINKNKKVIMILGIVIILSGIGFAVAYTMNAINVSIGTGEYAVVYTGTATLPSTKLEPIVDSSVLSSTDKIIKINFTVKGASTNPTNKSIIYDVSLTNLNIPGTARSEHLKWMLYKNGSKISEGSFSPEFDALVNRRIVLTNIQQDLPSYSSTADSYIFYMWISEACTDSDITNCTPEMDVSGITDKTISGEIRIELSTGSKKALIRPLSEFEEIFIGNMPVPKGQYVVNTSVCSDIDMTYDYSKKRFKIFNVLLNGNILCSPTVTQTTRQNLATYIKDELTGTTQGNGQVVNENGYRYEGKNPNNYIIFNDELWRIIGVFDETSHGQTGQYLTKIIREDSIGALVWDKNGKNNWGLNNWPTSDLYYLLNGPYYNREDGTDVEHCYKFRNIMQGLCDYRTIGIQEDYREMIKNVIWYLGGYSSGVTTIKINDLYTQERSSDSTYYYGDNAHTANGYVGLMYLSDYGYSVLSSSCPRKSYGLANYDYDRCAGNAWLKHEKIEWTITQVVKPEGTTNSGSIGSITSSGSFSSLGMASGYSASVRPTVYLDSFVYIVTGDGSLTNPYIIGIN